MLGASWRTDLAGWIIIGGDFAKLIADTISKQGIPTEPGGWIAFGVALATGVGLIMAKDGKVSNAPSPVAPQQVPPGV